MKVFLAESGGLWGSYIKDEKCFEGAYILRSFYYMNEFVKSIIPKCKMFLLDSGAYTFMANQKGLIDWQKYVKEYARFINENKIQYFFELDIDSIVGYEKVKEYRKLLEKETGKKCIPVWHKSRGKDEFLKMCDEYDYVAIGGIVTKEITKDQYPFFTWFLNEAHKRGCKVHGLGFTSLKDLTKYKFDTVDSTAWTTGNRFGGKVYFFNGKTIVNVDKPQFKKIKDHTALAHHNFNEWLKYQRYADKNL